MNRESRFSILKIASALLVKHYYPNSTMALADDLFDEIVSLATISPDHQASASIKVNNDSINKLNRIMRKHNCENTELANALIKKVSEIYPAN